MYNINTKSNVFNERTKSVFEVLENLESTHKTKQLEYIETSEQEVSQLESKNTTELNPTGIIEVNESIKCEHLFKIPAVPKRTIESNEIVSSKRQRSSGFSRDPEKWQKYTFFKFLVFFENERLREFFILSEMATKSFR